MKVPQSRAELEAHLREQVGLIRMLAHAYDTGETGTAKILATHIYLLLQDGPNPNSSSLLSQLGLKDRLLFLDTSAPYDSRNLVFTAAAFTGLVGWRISARVGGIEYMPRLDAPMPGPGPRRLGFDAWWSQVVIKDARGVTFTRCELIRTVRDKDGGAHIDATLDEPFAALKRQQSIGWTVTLNGEEVQFQTGPELASIRQIAHELLETLKVAHMSLGRGE